MRGGLERRAERDEGALEDCGCGAEAGKVYKIPEGTERSGQKFQPAQDSNTYGKYTEPSIRIYFKQKIYIPERGLS